MQQNVRVIYENGILRPLIPLNLPERVEIEVQISLPKADPFFELLGAFQSDKPLIDGIAVSEDPDLYLAAAEMEKGELQHAWEIAPARYRRGEQGQAIRLDTKTV